MSSLLVSKGSNFLKNSDIIEEGDTVVVYVNYTSQYAIVVKRGVTLHMKYGALRHEFLIGKRYGTPISATAGYVYALRANPHLWTKTLQKRTQILYTPDIGAILLLLDVKPGVRVCETGTGSGSLTHALATAVAPQGHVYSHDIDASRVEAVQADIKAHGLAEHATIVLQDACKQGFAATDCDCMFLDLPSPWLAIGHARAALSTTRAGRLVSFSPCIEQVQQVVLALERHGFIQLETVEIVPQKLKVIELTCETLADAASQGSNPPAKFKKDPPAAAEEVPMSTTEEPMENAKEKQQQIGDGNSSRKRKAPMGRTFAASSAGTSGGGDDRKPAFLDAIPFPPTQPTHTGYLTSATLLPRLNTSSSSPSTSSSSADVQQQSSDTIIV